MRIYTDRNGVTVEALNTLRVSGGPDGHSYAVDHGGAVVAIEFQRGPVKKFGLNGLSTEALLAICHHRLTVLNMGQYRCFQNARAIASIADALAQLEDRAKERALRGVAGTSQA